MKPTIVILHGWQSKVNRWRPIKTALEKKGFKVFLPQLPGMGKKAEPRQPWGVPEYSRWVIEFLKRNKIRKPVLVGHSFGGRLAIYLGATQPKFFKGLVLINAAGVKRKSLKRPFFWLIAKLGKGVLAIPPLSWFKKPFRWLLYQLAREKDYYQASPLMRQTLKKVVSLDLTPLLGKIKLPTLILWGEKDRQTPLKDGRLMANQIANSDFKVFKNEGHGLPFSQHKAVVRQIEEFVNRWS